MFLWMKNFVLMCFGNVFILFGGGSFFSWVFEYNRSRLVGVWFRVWGGEGVRKDYWSYWEFVRFLI